MESLTQEVEELRLQLAEVKMGMVRGLGAALPPPYPLHRLALPSSSSQGLLMTPYQPGKQGKGGPSSSTTATRRGGMVGSILTWFGGSGGRSNSNLKGVGGRTAAALDDSTAPGIPSAEGPGRVFARRRAIEEALAKTAKQDADSVRAKTPPTPSSTAPRVRASQLPRVRYDDSAVGGGVQGEGAANGEGGVTASKPSAVAIIAWLHMMAHQPPDLSMGYGGNGNGNGNGNGRKGPGSNGSSGGGGDGGGGGT